MKFKNIPSFCEYTNAKMPRNEDIDIGEYSADFRLASPPVYPAFYRISIKYGLEEDKQQGYMYFSSPNQAIEWNTKVPWRGYYINITEELISNSQHLAYSFLKYGSHEPLLLESAEEAIITGAFKGALQEYNKESYSIKILLAYCNLMFAHIAEFYKRQFGEQKEKYAKLVDDFFHLLHTFYDNPQSSNIEQPSVSYFAQALNVTPNYLSDLIKFYTGKSALSHIHQHIIETAKPLIIKKEATITEIAYQLGFEYPNYFSRLFRKHTGHTPSKFRNL